MAGVVTIELDSIYNYIERQAFKAVGSSTTTATENVRKHAPVRKLFRGTTFKTGKTGFRKPITRTVRTRSGKYASGESRAGHANSELPLFRRRDGKTTSFISGDFRRVSISRPGHLARIGTGFRASTIGKGGPSGLGSEDRNEQPLRPGSTAPGELAVFQRFKGGRVQKLDPSKLKPVSAEDLTVAGGKAVTTRGRFEIRSGRANFRGTDNVVRVGGRLKGEIHSEGPVIEDGIIWGYVVSATKDPQTGRLYPRDQEFGTVHNRPHPFMRPGLHESRGTLRRELREAIRRGPQ